MFPNEKITFQHLLNKLMSGEWSELAGMFVQYISDALSYELRHSKNSMIELLVLIITATLFSNLANVFQSKQVSEVGFLCIYMMILAICLKQFQILTDLAAMNVMRILEFMKVLAPVYFFAIAISIGSSTSVSFYHFILLLFFVIDLVVLNFLIPMVQLYFMMRLLGEFSPEVSLSKFANFLETMIKGCLKLMTGGAVGANIIQALLVPTIDALKRGVLLKGGASLPFIGNLFGQTTEILIGTAVLVKNGIGVVGMIVCIAMCIGPVIQIGISALMYQLIAAVLEPVADKRMVNCISSVGDAGKLLLKVVYTTALVFLLLMVVVSVTRGGL
jgi:stage III sporulation protein AE